MEKMRKHHKQPPIILCKILFLFTLVVFSALTLATSAQSTTFSISPTDDLQTIINNAESNQTLVLSEGTYTQQLSINKPLTLTAAHPETTIISATTLPNQPAISITSDYVILENLTLRNNADGIYTTGVRITAEHTKINNCIIHHTPVGIAIWTSNNIITNSQFHHCADEGIVLLSTSYATCANNTISHCVFTNNCDAIELQESTHNWIINCTMTNNTHSGIDAIIKNNNHNIISHCTITNNQVHGIYLSSSSNNIISSCILQNNADGNIIQPNSFDNTILNKTHIDQQINQLTQQNQIEQTSTSPILALIKQKISGLQLRMLSVLQNMASLSALAHLSF